LDRTRRSAARRSRLALDRDHRRLEVDDARVDLEPPVANTGTTGAATTTPASTTAAIVGPRD